MTLNRYGPALTLIALLGGVAAASAQSTMPVETVQPNGAVVPSLALTPAQRSAVSNSVERQRVHGAPHGITAAVGAPVEPSLALPNVPDNALLSDDDGNFLKYATVAGDIVIVDPIRMRVVEVIHSGAGP